MSLVRMLCFGAVLALGSAAPAYGDFGQPYMSVEWQDGRLSVNADGVPFRELLAAIAKKAGVDVQGLSTLEGRAFIHFSNLPLRDGLEALLTQINYAMIGEPSAHGGEQRIVLIVVGHKSGSGSGTTAGRARGRAPQTSEPVTADGPDRYQDVERLAEQGDVRALREAAAFGDPTTQALAMQRLARQDPAEARRAAIDGARNAEATQRVLAVQVLGGLDDPEAMDALSAALMDPDADVRRAAVVGLMGQRSPAATHLLVQALQDSAESVRLLAQELLAHRGAAGTSVGIR